MLEYILVLILLIGYVISVSRKQFSINSVTIRFIITHVVLFFLLAVADGDLSFIVPASHYSVIIVPYIIIRTFFQLIRNKSLNLSESE